MGDVLVERETSADPEHEVSIEEPTLSAVEAEAKRILQGNGITKDQLVGLWDLIPKAKCMKDRRGALMAAFGMSSRSRKHPFKMTRTLPNVTEVLTRFARTHLPNLYFASIIIREGADAEVHKDHLNSFLPSAALGLTDDLVGGGLWVQCKCRAPCQEPVVYRGFEGRLVKGHHWDIRARPFVFSPRAQLHATQAWEGNRRVVFLAYVPQGALHIHESLHLELRELGFCVPHPQAILSAAQDHLHESEQMTTQHQLTLREAFRSSPSQLWRRRQAPSAPATSEVELVLSSDEEREGPVVDVPYKRRCLAVLCSDSLEENGQHAAEIASDGENEP